MESTFTAIFEKADDWYIGYVEELPETNTQGRTLEETRENLRVTIKLIQASNRELAKKRLNRKGICSRRNQGCCLMKRRKLLCHLEKHG